MTGIMQMIASHKVPSAASAAITTLFDFSNPPQLVSANFNGTSHQLLANSSVFTQTSDFTVEGWYYPSSVTGTHYLFTLGTEVANRYSYFLSGNAITSNIYGGNSISYSSTVSINTWNHIAVVRNGSTVKLYLNGTASATTDTQSGTIGTGNLRIGADSGGLNRFAGYMSNFRVSSSADYINDFTRPTRPFLANGNVATTSASFDGTSQYLSTTGGAGTAMSTGDFTWEGWIRPTGSTGYQTFIDTRTAPLSGGDTTGFYFGTNTGTLTPIVYTTSTILSASANLTLNTWSHVALTRSSGNLTIWVGGINRGTLVGDTTDLTQQTANIGGSGGLYLSGQISNLRMVKGLAVYTGSFTPPANGLTTTQSSGTNISAITTETQLLLPLTITPFTDVSTNAFTITNTGNVTTANTSVTNTQFLAPLGAVPFTDVSKNGIAMTNVGAMILANASPFSATWVDSVSNISATVATAVNSGGNPTYDGRYGGGIIISETSQSYVDVPTASSLSALTISMAAVLPAAQGSHYVSIFDGSVTDRAGQYINSRNWVGDGLEVGGQGTWAYSNSTTVPSMGTLAWWDFVFNGRIVTVYKNGALVTMTGSDMGAGNQITGWKNPLRFCGDDSVASNNTMWPGTVYRMIHWNGALTAGQVTTQFNTVRALYGL